MARFTRTELEQAFRGYVEQSADAVARGDWNAWADRFTEDALYVEHHFGTFRGREAIRRWITETMAPVSEMTFPIEWSVIDEEKDAIVFQAWNRMPDPDGGGPYQAPSWTLLRYAGGGLWSYQEDIYNPNEFMQMMERWSTANARGKAKTST